MTSDRMTSTLRPSITDNGPADVLKRKAEPTNVDGLPSRYGPFANGCGYCGASLLTGMKPAHIKWHESQGDPAPSVEDTQQ